MKAIDTNILVYAHREECEQHKVAKEILVELSEGPHPWAIAWPCLYEFLRVVTHPRVFHPPTAIGIAWENVGKISESPSLILLHETERHLGILKQLITKTKVRGNLIHDAHIAALLIEHGVKEIVTGDEDFKRFDELTIIDPFI